MLGLKLPTDPRWVNIVEKDIDEILTDHAYCEQKAASTAISLIINFPEYPDLVQEMVALSREEMGEILKKNLTEADFTWLQEYVDSILETRETAKLYLLYSLLGSRIGNKPVNFDRDGVPEATYLLSQDINQRELSRLYLLIKALETDFEFFSTKVAKIIELADSTELVTFLKYLVLLPQADYFKPTAVEALRTNITPVFEAISMKNPYPSAYFDDQQWNQMYLKAAFMQLDLSAIIDVEERSNAELARIISDYAHERWAASRQIDPMIWRPVSKFMNKVLLTDMKRLLDSDNPVENKAGALSCFHSDDELALIMLKDKRPELIKQIEENNLDWNNLND